MPAPRPLGDPQAGHRGQGHAHAHEARDAIRRGVDLGVDDGLAHVGAPSSGGLAGEPLEVAARVVPVADVGLDGEHLRLLDPHYLGESADLLAFLQIVGAVGEAQHDHVGEQREPEVGAA